MTPSEKTETETAKRAAVSNSPVIPIRARIRKYLQESPRLVFLRDYFRDLGVLILIATGGRLALTLLAFVIRSLPIDGLGDQMTSYLPIDPIRITITALDIVIIVSIMLLSIFGVVRFGRYLYGRVWD